MFWASKCLHHAGEVLRGTYQLSCARCLSHYVRSEQQLVILVEEKVTIALAGTCVSAPLGHVGCALCVSAVLQLLPFQRIQAGRNVKAQNFLNPMMYLPSEVRCCLARFSCLAGVFSDDS